MSRCLKEIFFILMLAAGKLTTKNNTSLFEQI